MKKASFDDVSIFVEVAKANGFRAAAENLNLGAGSVSETIRRIESRLGVRLIERTTRKIALTDAGLQLLEQARPALADIEHAFAQLEEDDNQITGVLRLSAPHSSGPFFLDELLVKYSQAYPEVSLELIYDDNKVDLVSSGIDAAIRSQILLEQDSHAVPIGPQLDMALIASPHYLKTYGTPQSPQDLTQHAGIRYAFGSRHNLAPWRFKMPQSEAFNITPQPKFIVNDLAMMARYAKAGLGIAYSYRRPVEKAIEAGELRELFTDYIPEMPRYAINYLTKRHMPMRLRAFIDMAKSM